jgi:hypothetical protein
VPYGFSANPSYVNPRYVIAKRPMINAVSPRSATREGFISSLLEENGVKLVSDYSIEQINLNESRMDCTKWRRMAYMETTLRTRS